MAELYVNSYCWRGQHPLLAALLLSHAPLLDSRALASKLEAGWSAETASSSSLPATTAAMPAALARRLAREMWGRLGDRAAAARLTLCDAGVVAALREVKAHGLEGSVVAQECLEAAAAGGDAGLVAAAHRMLAAAAT